MHIRRQEIERGYVQTGPGAGKLPHMDPVGVKLTPDDLGAGDFPLPGVFGPPRPVARETTDGTVVEGDPDSADYLIGDWFAPRPHRPLHSTRCIAVKTNGERCRKWAVIGFERCEVHSGYGKLANLAQYRERVIERARLDLIRAAPYAVERLVELSRDRDINPAVSMKASTEILDRVGVKGGAELDVTVRTEGEQSPAEIIRARLDRLAAGAAAAELESATESVIDAEVVDDDDRAS